MFKRRKPDDYPAFPSAPQPAAPGASEGLLEGGMMAADPMNRPAQTQAGRADFGIGVPPFRPAEKETQDMGRSPFPAQPAPPSSQPAPGMSGQAAMPGSNGQTPPQRPGAQPAPRREAAERRTLVVGRGISVQGTVTDAERLVVEGTVEASMIHAAELVIAPGGIFKGEAEVEDTEIAGTIDGTLTARGNMIVRSSGKVLGTARCRRLQVEDGGQITGRMEMLTETPRAAEALDAS